MNKCRGCLIYREEPHVCDTIRKCPVIKDIIDRLEKLERFEEETKYVERKN